MAGRVNIQRVNYKVDGIDVVANVYTPANYNPKKSYAAVVVAHPNGGSKDQVAGLYAQHLTETIRQTCQDILDEEAVIVGTSTLTGTELDCIVNQYSGIYTNPFLAWGRYRKGWLKTTLPISFQFHHAQMDSSHAAHFLEELQKTINHV